MEEGENWLVAGQGARWGRGGGCWGVFERERENPRGPGERACGGEAMQHRGSTDPGASTMRHHREAAEQGLA